MIFRESGTVGVEYFILENTGPHIQKSRLVLRIYSIQKKNQINFENSPAWFP